MSEGYIRWVRRELARHGLRRPIWDMEARSEPRLVFNRLVQFHPQLVVPNGRAVLRALQRPGSPRHASAVRWYRAEQARVLTKVFVCRFAAGFEKVFMGMPHDWDRSLARFTVANPYIGLASADGRPWPAFHAMRLLVQYLDHFRTARRMRAPEGVALYRFDFANNRPAVWVAWLEEQQPRSLDDPLPVRAVTLPGISGTVRVLTIPTEGDQTTELHMGSRGAVLRLKLSPTPVLIVPAPR